jgi:hypothetical protein
MERRRLVELQDLPWCPRFIRDALTDLLHAATVMFDLYGPAVPTIREALEKLDCRVIPAFRKAAQGEGEAVSYIEYPVDAGDVPKDLRGFRTLFSSFHHFDPDSARKILGDAAEGREGIGIFEVNERDPLALLLTHVTPVAVLAAMPFIKPRTWKRFFWTYLVPAIPLVAGWDGLVSNLRAYSVGN